MSEEADLLALNDAIFRSRKSDEEVRTRAAPVLHYASWRSANFTHSLESVTPHSLTAHIPRGI